ncbi:MAG: multicopper oxidase [Bryobacteraceae bacterium]
MTRREFLQASVASPLFVGRDVSSAASFLDPNRLSKFVDCLSLPPIAQPTGMRSVPSDPESKAPLYRLSMRQMERKIHRDLPPTKMWGFDSISPGPTMEAKSGQPVFVEWVNELPDRHFLPIDYSIHGADFGKPEVRTVVHLHGARVPPQSDGYPENWYTSGKSMFSFYPNLQDATALWYHDHAMGITRLNIFAGLFGFYLLRDDAESALNLPTGKYEIPLALYDRSFRADGQLYYPVSDIPAKPWISEFFGDAILANGTLFPYLDVEAHRYRFRLLNASNSRFLYLSLSNEQEAWQIGADQGLLAAPVSLKRLTLAPGERADVVIDFKNQMGQRILLRSDNYTILQFRVASSPGVEGNGIPAKLRTISKIEEKEAVRTRLLTLEGGGDSDDPTSIFQPMLLNGTYWHQPVTENPTLHTTEIWSFINLTDDSHPIHLHLVRFQVLDRRPFDLFTYLNERKLMYTAAAIPPDPNELGWKDTVRADPGMVTRIIIRFEGFAGRYVWHCHVLEHEDYEMMRPYDVLAPSE